MKTIALKNGTGELETKAALSFEIKDADRGEVWALVSTLNVVDREGDVMLTGSIQDGATVKLSAYAHDVITEDKAPVGLGTISVQGDRVIMKGNYFLNTERGRDAFETVKSLGPHTEWSIGFPKNVKTAPMTSDWSAKGARRLVAGLTIMESSPVFLAANALTQTLAVKATEEVVEAVGQADGAGTTAAEDTTIVAVTAETKALDDYGESIAAIARHFEASMAEQEAAAAADDALHQYATKAAERERQRINDTMQEEVEQIMRTMQNLEGLLG